MADLLQFVRRIKSPNPFWLASAPPTTPRPGDARLRRRWGGAGGRRSATPIVDTSSRFGALDVGGTKMVGFNNIG